MEACIRAHIIYKMLVHNEDLCVLFCIRTEHEDWKWNYTYETYTYKCIYIYCIYVYIYSMYKYVYAYAMYSFPSEVIGICVCIGCAGYSRIRI